MLKGISQKFEASKAARKARHDRVFGHQGIIALTWRKAGDLTTIVQSGVARLKGMRVVLNVAGQAIHTAHTLKHRFDNRIVAPTAGTLYKRIAALTLAVMVGGGVLGASFDTTSAQFDGEAYANIDQDVPLIASDDGYFAKANPQTGSSSVVRSAHDGTVYAVAVGDTLSGVAQRFKLKTETVMWENGLTAASVLKIGQRLVIPPANGISHTVANGQTIEKIASLYKVSANDIIAMNNLQSGVITKGQTIFVPGARPLPDVRPQPRTIARAPARDAPARNIRREAMPGTDAKPTAGRFMIFPTIGQLTQGFRAGHYAYDIANSSKPPIWAAASGTVVKASEGTWGGGYGNHVIIDHGNGVKTLYAHMDYLTVKEGQHVSQGDVIGRMGRTGRVRGVTGIHLHFEVIDNGVKRVPSKYY